MINILYAINGLFANGGTEAVVLNYFNNIDKSKFHIDFLLHGDPKIGKNNPVHQYLEANGSKLFYVTPRGESYFKNKKEMLTILKNNDYDIVHSHMDSAGAFFLKAAKKAGVKVRISHSHNTADQKINGNKIKAVIHKLILEIARKSLNKYATCRIACSEAAGRWLFGEAPFTVIKNAIDVDRFKFNSEIRIKYREDLGINGKFVVGHIGRFADQKNHDFIIDIFYELLKNKPNSILMLVGDGELRSKIEEKVKNLGIKDKVMFMGNRNDVPNLLQAMDIFLFPSKFEGLSVALIEAQTSGLPFITSNRLAEESYVLDNYIKLDLNDLCEKWVKAIDSICAKESRREAYATILEKKGYSISTVITEVQNFYIAQMEYMNR